MTMLALVWKWQLGLLRAGVFILAPSMVTAFLLSAVDPGVRFPPVTRILAMWGIAVRLLLPVSIKDPERATPDRADVIVIPAC